MQAFEILLIDDGSDDDTETHLAALAATDPRIQHLTQTNQGPGSARNHGCRVARGQWIAFLDHDDAWEPEKLALQLETAEGHPADVVFTAVRNMDVRDRVEPIRSAFEVQNSPSSVFRELLFDNFITLSSTLVRAEAIQKAGLFAECWRGVEDWALWLKMAEGGARFYGLNKPLVSYHWHQSSLSKQHGTMQAQRKAVVRQFLDTDAGRMMTRSDRQKIKANERRGSAWFTAEASLVSAALMYGQAAVTWPFEMKSWKGILKCMLFRT